MHYVYKITNLINGKMYIGKRKHKTPETDPYMGSGTQIKAAIEKYGRENFVKEIIGVFDTDTKAAALEAKLVTKEFVLDEMTYNMHEGGHGGFAHINENEKYSKIRADASKKGLARIKEKREDGTFDLSKNVFRTNKEIQSLGNSPDVRARAVIAQRKTLEKIGHSRGAKNSQYGTRWIYSLLEQKSRKIEKDAPLPEGWLEGRKIKWG